MLAENIKKIIPTPLLKILRYVRRKYREIKIPINHLCAIARVRKKKKIKVVFFVIHESVWKYGELYWLMQNGRWFEPLLMICPYIVYDEVVMKRDMDQAYDNFKKKGYNVIKSFDEVTGRWIDVKKKIKPDLVFFTNPWSGITKKQYTILNYLDTLTCYVPYGFKNSNLYEAHFNMDTQNYVWRFFLETKIHQKLSGKYARNKGINTVVTGYPGMDKLLKQDYVPVDVWKIKDRSVRRIIWAPHHTIPGMGATLDYSTFLTYSEFMLEIASRYNGQIQIAFKPHPILRAKLSRPDVWGIQKTDDYYRRWEMLSNGQLEKGEYVDLFLTSDAMIHDSSSFVIEYLYTGKPVMFLINDDSVLERFNEVGMQAMNRLYQGRSEMDVDRFVTEVVLCGKDDLKSERTAFFQEIVRPPNNRTASENIYTYLQAELTGD